MWTRLVEDGIVSRGVTGVLNDPLVPLDFGGWFNRVFGVIRRDFRRSAALAAVPAAVYAVGVLAMVAVVPSPERTRWRLERAAEASGGDLGPATMFRLVFGDVLPVALVFVAVLLVVGAFYVGVAFHLAVREANGQPSTVAQALTFARPRVLPLIGWALLAELVMTAVLAVAMLPGALAGIGWLVAVGALVGVLAMLVVLVVFAAAMVGVVVLERGGVRRAVELVRGRFWPTCGRLAVAGLLYMAWGGLMNLATLPLAATSGVDGSITFGVVIGVILQAALLVPAMMFVVAVCLVSYAELRHREDRVTNTATLAAQLAS